MHPTSVLLVACELIFNVGISLAPLFCAASFVTCTTLLPASLRAGGRAYYTLDERATVQCRFEVHVASECRGNCKITAKLRESAFSEEPFAVVVL